MLNQINISQRKAAIVAGLALVVMAITAGFSYGYVFERLVDPGNPIITNQNIRANLPLFRAGIFGWLFILLLDVLVAWALYVFLKKVNRTLSLLTAWIRIGYAGVLGVAILNLIMVLLLLGDADGLNALDGSQLESQVMLSLMAFKGIWSIGLVIFGVHLLLLGYLVFKSEFIPKIWAILIVIAAVGYILISLGTELIPHFENVKTTLEMVFMGPQIVGELGLAVWLLIKGGKVSSRSKNILRMAQA